MHFRISHVHCLWPSWGTLPCRGCSNQEGGVEQTWVHHERSLGTLYDTPLTKPRKFWRCFNFETNEGCVFLKETIVQYLNDYTSFDSLVSAENIYRGQIHTAIIRPKKHTSILSSFTSKPTKHETIQGKVLEAVLATVFGQFYEGVSCLLGFQEFDHPTNSSGGLGEREGIYNN